MFKVSYSNSTKFIVIFWDVHYATIHAICMLKKILEYTASLMLSMIKR